MSLVRLVFPLALAAVFALAPQAAPAQTLKAVKERGTLLCGVSQGPVDRVRRRLLPCGRRGDLQ
jgi:ABC-type amino acid transport substrate-binding protein